MTSKNDITGDLLQSKINSDAYRDNYDRIFGKKTKNHLPTAYDGKTEVPDIKTDHDTDYNS